MSDLEMTRLCAKAMGIPVLAGKIVEDGDTFLWRKDSNGESYCPLHDDAQAMALVKRFGLRIIRTSGDIVEWSVATPGLGPIGATAMNADLNRAIVECVAKIV